MKFRSEQRKQICLKLWLELFETAHQQLNETQQRYEKSEAKQVNYLSLEYLIGRSLRNNLVNEIYDVCQQVMERLGVNLMK